MGVSGRVKDAGLWELPFGHTARELIELAGGMQEGLAKAWLPGGASTDFLTASDEHLDLVMDFDPISESGQSFGYLL